MTDHFAILTQAIQQGKLIAVATLIAGPGIGQKLLLWPNGDSVGSLGNAALDEEIRARAQTLLVTQQNSRVALEAAGEPVEVFVEVHAPPPKLIIVGAVHIAIALVTFGKALGLHTIVVDARSAFATSERFEHADQLLLGWPADLLPELGIDEASYVTVLTHDEKIDVPALAAALASPARYIGALGSRKTHARRRAALLELGLSPEQLERIHSPIGLAISARRPEEIAVAIIAEMVAVTNSAPKAA